MGQFTGQAFRHLFELETLELDLPCLSPVISDFNHFETILISFPSFGGVPKYEQRQALRSGVEVVVATPGRLIDLMEEGEAELGGVSYLVLDEADRMLDQG